jgi:hypothetical protein
MKDWLASIFMILALLWLTISLPLIYDAQQKFLKLNLKEQQKQNKQSTPDNLLANTTEEKPASNSSISEEFLHDYSHQSSNIFCAKKLDFPHYDENLYLAFHGDLIYPPPNLQV